MDDLALVFAGLDPGIRDVVALLWRHGFTTTDSGDGVSKASDAGALDVPHVFAVVDSGLLIAESHRLADLLAGEDPGWTVEASYSPRDGVALLMAMYLPDEVPRG